jgi:hypothetical protein
MRITSDAKFESRRRVEVFVAKAIIVPRDGSEFRFEVDHVDEAMSAGSSVLVTDRVRRVSPEEFRRLEPLGIEPWAGVSGRYLRLAQLGISGRRIRTRT